MNIKKTQKFNKGDHVQVAKDLGSSMSHFKSDCEAIVIGSYDDQFGRGDIEQYTIHIKDRGETSWYHKHQLEIIEANRLDLLEKWESDEKKEADMKSDLDWIFSNGEDVLERPHGATISALAKCFGLTNLWGSQGEGITYHINAMGTLEVARAYLEAGDKNGWIEACKSIGNQGLAIEGYDEH